MYSLRVENVTMRTPFMRSCASIEKTSQYKTQGCPKCHTGTLEFVFDAQANDHYASCLNCGMQFYQHIEQVGQGALAQAA